MAQAGCKVSQGVGRGSSPAACEAANEAGPPQCDGHLSSPVAQPSSLGGAQMGCCWSACQQHLVCVLCAGGPATPHSRHLHCLPPGLCHASPQPGSRRCAPVMHSHKHSSTQHSLLLATSAGHSLPNRCPLCRSADTLQPLAHACRGQLWAHPARSTPAWAACSHPRLLGLPQRAMWMSPQGQALLQLCRQPSHTPVTESWLRPCFHTLRAIFTNLQAMDVPCRVGRAPGAHDSRRCHTKPPHYAPLPAVQPRPLAGFP